MASLIVDLSLNAGLIFTPGLTPRNTPRWLFKTIRDTEYRNGVFGLCAVTVTELSATGVPAGIIAFGLAVCLVLLVCAVLVMISNEGPKNLK